ncbi:STAS domain-containing protein [Armatimonas sp.]|uniref:STAS domain-containing protein n=1 Tax=Armatimonas sp. TaxID=1872638 RepID=UPI00374FE299
MAELTIQTTIQEGVPLVALTGELDAYHAPRLKTELENQLGGSPRILVISLKRVSYVDSTGLGVLVAVRKQAEPAGVSLHLVMSPESAVRRTFTITGLLPVFSIFDDEAAALEAAAFKEG